jgi:hypothetical protein
MSVFAADNGNSSSSHAESSGCSSKPRLSVERATLLAELSSDTDGVNMDTSGSYTSSTLDSTDTYSFNLLSGDNILLPRSAILAVVLEDLKKEVEESKNQVSEAEQKIAIADEEVFEKVKTRNIY